MQGPARSQIDQKANQAAWLLKAITCIDLTTLSGDDTENRVRRLCRKGRFPVRGDLLEQLGIDPGSITTGAICVYHEMVGAAVRALEGSGIPVAASPRDSPPDSPLFPAPCGDLGIRGSRSRGN